MNFWKIVQKYVDMGTFHADLLNFKESNGEIVPKTEKATPENATLEDAEKPEDAENPEEEEKKSEGYESDKDEEAKETEGDAEIKDETAADTTEEDKKEEKKVPILRQVGLKVVIKHWLGKDLCKFEQMSNWEKRPLRQT